MWNSVKQLLALAFIILVLGFACYLKDRDERKDSDPNRGCNSTSGVCVNGAEHPDAVADSGCYYEDCACMQFYNGECHPPKAKVTEPAKKVDKKAKKSPPKKKPSKKRASPAETTTGYTEWSI